RDFHVTGVQTCALPILSENPFRTSSHSAGFHPNQQNSAMYFFDRRAFLKSSSAAVLGGAFAGRVVGQERPLSDGRYLRVGHAQRSEERRVGKEGSRGGE